MLRHVFSIVSRVRIISIVLIVLFMSSILQGCARSESELDDSDQMAWQFSSYRDVPGVTPEEIEAIEAFREQGASFTYGMIFNTEAYINSFSEID